MCSKPPIRRSPPLTGAEAIELRRWVIGPEGKSRGRRRGLSARLADVASYDEEGARAIAQAREAAEALPSDGWLARLQENAPIGPLEALLAATRAVVHARDESGGQEAGYGLETEIAQMDGAFIEAAGRAQEALEALRQPSPGWRCGWKRSWRTAPTGSTGRARADRGRARRDRLADRSGRRVDRPAQPPRRPR
jgi:ATP-dependent DNA helicase DinG